VESVDWNRGSGDPKHIFSGRELSKSYSYIN